jgi:hypothetical protein
MDEIVNKVQESGLIQLDLETFKSKVEIVEIDLASQLWQGLVLKEKDFRNWIKTHDWTQYEQKAVYVHCTADAIVPTWAFMLVGLQLEGTALKSIIGNKTDLACALIADQIFALDITPYQDAKLIIKGCSDIEAPEYAMTILVQRLKHVAKSIMYGEPCSTVPLYKRKIES